MFIEPTIAWVLLGFSGYIWLDKKIVLKYNTCAIEITSRLVLMYKNYNEIGLHSAHNYVFSSLFRSEQTARMTTTDHIQNFSF